jgi:hypothetical protein
LSDAPVPTAAEHAVAIVASSRPSGIYTLDLRHASGRITRKIVVVH